MCEESNNMMWVPLESNPEVMTSLINRMGVSPGFAFQDIYGLDKELLSFISGECIAFILLFPISDNYKNFCLEEKARIEKGKENNVSNNAFFMKQTIGNACGTIAVFHAVGNNRQHMKLLENSTFDKFFKLAGGLSPDDRGKSLENNAEVRDYHKTHAQQGQTSAPSSEDNVDLHFVAMTEVDGHVYEFDGRKPFPINHGDCTKEGFLLKAAGVCREFMLRDPEETRFNIIALTKEF